MKLAVALDHKYTKTNLCFGGLKGHDRVVVELLRRCGGGRWLELHLCLVTKSKVFSDGDLICDSEETENWIGDDDQRRGFSWLSLKDQRTEVVMNREDLFRGLHDEEDHLGFMGNYGPEDQYWYHSALVVAWPRSESAGIACRGGFGGALDMMESKVKQKLPEASELYRALVEFCRSNPTTVWNAQEYRRQGSSVDICRSVRGEYTCRLLKIGLELGQTGDLLRLMDVLAGEISDQMYKGIASEAVANALAAVVESLGWEICRFAIDKLLQTNRFMKEGDSYGILGFQLEALGCHEAAVFVAGKVFEMLSTCSTVKEMTDDAVKSIGKLLFCVAQDRVPAFVELMSREAETATLCDLVAELKDEDAVPLPVRESFTRLCWTIVTRDLNHQSVTTLGCELVETFLWLGDASLLQALKQELLSGDGNQAFMKTILGDENLWNLAMTTETGKQVFTALACGRVDKLVSESKPVFSWCQPRARFPEHPQVEEFLRGPEESFTYGGGCFRSVQEPRYMAKTYFHGKLMNGFSAVGHAGGRARSSYCEIQKTVHAFGEIMKMYQDGQKELKGLQERLGQGAVKRTRRN